MRPKSLTCTLILSTTLTTMGCLGSLEDGGGSDDAGPNGSGGSSGEGGTSESGVVMLNSDGGADRGASDDSGPVSVDRDDDGVTDGDDNCPDHANATQQDADGDGVGDACDEGELPGDRDHDGIPDLEDICPDEPDIDAQTDQDSDGFAPCTGDCDDGDRARSPGSQERCDDVDDDCDGNVDEDALMANDLCSAGSGQCRGEGFYVCRGLDGLVCNAVASPPRAEVCNDLDDDCDGTVDDGVQNCCQPGARRACGSDVGACQAGQETCDGSRRWTACGAIGPQPESCNGLDDDCDGLEDQGFDFDSDPANCGGCEVFCEFGQVCRFGFCEGGQGTAITPNIGYGHHGNCDLWNSCRTGEGCATLACRNQGFAGAVDWVEGTCSGIQLDGLTCSIFSNNSFLDPENWIPQGGCDLPVAYRVRCER